MTARLMPRSVAGMAAAVSPASPAVTPGMIRNVTPAPLSARCLRRERHLAAPREPARISALEPQHALSLARELDEAVGDGALLGGRTAAALAREFEPRLGARERQHPAIHERVVNDDVGL